MKRVFNLKLRNKKLIFVLLILIFLEIFIFGNVLFLINQKKSLNSPQEIVSPDATIVTPVLREVIHESVVYPRKASCSGGAFTNEIE